MRLFNELLIINYLFINLFHLFLNIYVYLYYKQKWLNINPKIMS